MKDNIIVSKSFNYAIKVVKLYQTLKDQKEYALANQFLRSGTSIGANIYEATQGQSRKDFVPKLAIALKKAYECEYWLKLFEATSIIPEDTFIDLHTDVSEIIKILTSIIKTTKSKEF